MAENRPRLISTVSSWCCRLHRRSAHTHMVSMQCATLSMHQNCWSGRNRWRVIIRVRTYPSVRRAFQSHQVHMSSDSVRWRYRRVFPCFHSSIGDRMALNIWRGVVPLHQRLVEPCYLCIERPKTVHYRPLDLLSTALYTFNNTTKKIHLYMMIKIIGLNLKEKWM